MRDKIDPERCARKKRVARGRRRDLECDEPLQSQRGGLVTIALRGVGKVRIAHRERELERRHLPDEIEGATAHGRVVEATRQALFDLFQRRHLRSC